MTCRSERQEPQTHKSGIRKSCAGSIKHVFLYTLHQMIRSIAADEIQETERRPVGGSWSALNPELFWAVWVRTCCKSLRDSTRSQKTEPSARLRRDVPAHSRRSRVCCVSLLFNKETSVTLRSANTTEPTEGRLSPRRPRRKRHRSVTETAHSPSHAHHPGTGGDRILIKDATWSHPRRPDEESWMLVTGGHQL